MLEQYHGTETILLADDEPIVLSLAANILKFYGYRVLEARGGEEAVDIYGRHQKVDLVVTDVIMPLMTGPQLIHALRQKNAELRCLYMSGFDQTTIRLRAGTDICEYLQKPFTPADLLKRVRAALDASGDRSGASNN